MKRPAPKCKRCGKCCESSSPTLHISDTTLVTENHIGWSHLYTIRKGEYVWDNINKKSLRAPSELIKIKEKKSGCVLFELKKKACLIYHNRPAECRALFCKDTTGFFRVYDTPRLARKDVIKDTSLTRLIDEHERKCSYHQVEHWLTMIGSVGEEAVQEIIRIVRYDYELRNLVVKRLHVAAESLEFLFGRPMIETISNYGLKVVQDKDGTFLLTKKLD